MYVIICLLHITCFTNIKPPVEVQESVDKTAKQILPPVQFFPPIWRQASAKI